MDNIKPTLLISIIGPNTKNANNDPLVKVEAKDKAKKESMNIIGMKWRQDKDV